MPVFRTGNHLLDLSLAAVSLPVKVGWLRGLFQEIAPDLVHVHYVNDAGLFSVLTGFRPIVVTAWGSDILISPQRSWVRGQAVRYVLRKADLITCDADHMKRRIVALGAEPDRVKVVFFGTDVDHYHPGRRDPDLKSRLAPRGQALVISIRSLEPVYDVQTLIRAIPVVLERFPGAVFLVGGSGSQAEGLRRLAADLGVEDSTYFPGSLSQEELPGYLATSDVYVSTALSDAGIASSTAEAMACGVPVVITDVADNRQWVEDGANGFLFPPGDEATLARRIVELLEDSALRMRMGVRGRQVVVERLNLWTEMLRMESLYEAVCRGANPPEDSVAD